MGWVMLSFGIIGLYNAYEDTRNYRNKNITPNYQLYTHIGRMVGGYTATITAVLVVNGDALPDQVPEVILWLSPTLLLTPLSIHWIRKHKNCSC